MRRLCLFACTLVLGCKAAPNVDQQATAEPKPTCEMFETRTKLPDRWTITEGAPSVNAQCYSQALVLAAAPNEVKARLLTCPPDDSSAAWSVGEPSNFVAYRKFRTGDGVVDLGVVWMEGERLGGFARVDRIASGKAIETNYLDELNLTAVELNEVIDALLHTQLVAFTPKSKTAQVRGTFENRCRNWEEPARGATELTLQQALTFPLPTPSAAPSISRPSAQPATGKQHP